MKKLVKQWLMRDPDPSTKAELQSLIDDQNWEEIEQRFSSRLQFGTAGLRGEVGAGPNRMNRLVIQETALGLANYLLNVNPNAKTQGIIIGYDARPLSKQFAYDTATQMVASGIPVYLSHKFSPTPVIAFGINKLGTAAGVVVTASHNPPQDNGFKVYWQNGAQIIAPHDSGIAACIDEAAASALPNMTFEQACESDLFHWLDDAFFQQYEVNLLVSAKSKNSESQFKVAYTPMHGVGAETAESIIQAQGLCELHSVPSQREPDGTFPTVNFPNPEEPGAMDRVITLANEINADYAIANDPDADRFAVAVRKPDDKFQMLTGDQVGSLLADHLLKSSNIKGWVGNTIVSSRMLNSIAKQYGVEYFQTLTGFKWLANVAMDKRSDDKPFIFAYEEALGYAIGQSVWDKDGLNAMLHFIDLIHNLKNEGKTVWQRLEELYQKHGIHFTAQKSLRLDSGSPSVGEALRKARPTQIAGKNVVMTYDYGSQQAFDNQGNTSAIELPRSDVLVYILDDDSRIIVRPSGTEPKLKCYYEQITPMQEGIEFWSQQAQAQESMHALINSHQAEIQALTD